MGGKENLHIRVFSFVISTDVYKHVWPVGGNRVHKYQRHVVRELNV